MTKKIIVILLLLDIVLSAGVLLHSRTDDGGQFENAEQILQAFRTPENVRAAAVINTVYTEMLPWSKEVKKNFALMNLCRKPQTVLELQKISTELALKKITGRLQENILNGTLADREAVIFAFSGTFTAWLYDVNDSSFIGDVSAFMNKTYGSLNESACTQEERKTLLFIDKMKFTIGAE
jgi:hypothetical protein